jgi:hypothetical protein
VPGEERRRCHAKGIPSGTREQAAECGEQGSIGRLEGLPFHLTPEHRYFVAQSEKLDLLRILRPGEENDKLEEVAYGEVDEGPQLASHPLSPHEMDGSGQRPLVPEKDLLRPLIVFSDSTGFRTRIRTEYRRPLETTSRVHQIVACSSRNNYLSAGRHSGFQVAVWEIGEQED